MSTYDKVAFGNRPSLYLSAPEITDKSGGSSFILTSNNLNPVGQPLIFGSEFSFVMDDDDNVGVVGNPLFFNDTSTFECVIYTTRPEQDVPIIIDDDSQNALLITPDGITLKLFFESLLSTYSKTASVDIKNWSQKFYITVTVTATQATLTVNGESEIVMYSDTIISSSNVTVGGGYAGFQYLMDGIGFYSKTITNKSLFINDPFSGYSAFASARHGGRTTRFEGYTRGYIETFSLSDFLYSNGQYTLIYYVTAIQGELDYISVKSNDERVTVYYDINLDDPGEFTEYLLLGTVTDTTVRFVVESPTVDSDFSLTIEGISNGDVFYDTPADLVLSGLALYGEPSEAIVNFLDGTKLPDAAYTGTWMFSDDMPTTPKTVELVFKPVDDSVDTIVFASSDGSASYGPTGAITNFTAYLNGNGVTDLTGVRYGQWNHLVLIDTSPSALEFYLNSDDGLPADTTISYMLLTAYPNELTSDEITVLYEILTGIDKLQVSEAASIAEGTFSGGQAFNAYSYAWAILGAGGS